MTNASETRLALVTESTYGVTPATPTWDTARYVTESLSPNIDNIVSNEIRPDRNIPDQIQVGSNAGGDLSFELSYGSFDSILESLMYSAWSSDVLKNGTTQKSFTIEKTFETGGTDQYHRFTGAVANTMSLQIATDSIVTGSFGFACKGASSAQAEVASSTYNAPNTNSVINAGQNFSSLAITGATSPELTAIELNITNNLRQQKVLGSIESRGVAAGRFQASGTITAYFENEELYELFLAGTAADLSFQLGGPSSNNYVFDLPNIKFSSAEANVGGNDSDILLTMPFTALYDGTEDATLKITRTS